MNFFLQSVPGILILPLAHLHEAASFLDVFQNVWVVDVVLDGVGDWVVPGYVLVLELLFSLAAFFLLLDLLHNVLSEDHLVVFLLFHLLLLLQPLVVFELLKRLVLLVFLLLLSMPQVILILQLGRQQLVGNLGLMLLSLQMLVMGFIKGLSSVVVLFDVLFLFKRFLFVKVHIPLAVFGQLRR